MLTARGVAVRPDSDPVPIPPPVAGISGAAASRFSFSADVVVYISIALALYSIWQSRNGGNGGGTVGSFNNICTIFSKGNINNITGYSAQETVQVLEALRPQRPSEDVLKDGQRGFWSDLVTRLRKWLPPWSSAGQDVLPTVNPSTAQAPRTDTPDIEMASLHLSVVPSLQLSIGDYNPPTAGNTDNDAGGTGNQGRGGQTNVTAPRSAYLAQSSRATPRDRRRDLISAFRPTASSSQKAKPSGRTGRESARLSPELSTRGKSGQHVDQQHRASLAAGSSHGDSTSTRNRSGSRQENGMAINEES